MEGDAVQNTCKVFRKSEGCFLNIFDQDRIEDNLAVLGDPEDIDYIVVTDGEEVVLHGSRICRFEITDQGVDSRHYSLPSWRIFM